MENKKVIYSITELKEMIKYIENTCKHSTSDNRCGVFALYQNGKKSHLYNGICGI